MDNYPCSRLPTANLGAVASAVSVVTQEEHLHMGLKGWGIEAILSPVSVLAVCHVSSTLSLEWVNGPGQPDLSI